MRPSGRRPDPPGPEPTPPSGLPPHAPVPPGRTAPGHLGRRPATPDLARCAPHPGRSPMPRPASRARGRRRALVPTRRGCTPSDPSGRTPLRPDQRPRRPREPPPPSRSRACAPDAGARPGPRNRPAVRASTRRAKCARPDGSPSPPDRMTAPARPGSKPRARPRGPGTASVARRGPGADGVPLPGAPTRPTGPHTRPARPGGRVPGLRDGVSCRTGRAVGTLSGESGVREGGIPVTAPRTGRRTAGAPHPGSPAAPSSPRFFRCRTASPWLRPERLDR